MTSSLKLVRKNGRIDQTKPIVPSGSLKTTAISQIFRDASNDEILDLQKYVQWQLFERGQDVKVVLSVSKGDFKSRCVYPCVYATVIQPIIKDYVTLNCQNITETQRKNVVEFIRAAVSDSKTMELSESQLFEDYGMSLDELCRVYTEFMSTMDEIEEHEEYRKYFSMSFTNPYLINAVEQLRSEGVEISLLCLATVRVPYGKVMKERFGHHGDYVELVDEDYVSSFS
jgi:hypothetical protein